jgi:hypothetical protein
MRFIRPGVAVMLLVVAGGGSARAEEQPRKEALRIADEGAEAYKAGNYAEALQKFDKAYNLYPAPALLLNLSRTELKLGQCDSAIRYAQIYSADTQNEKASTRKSRTSWLEHVKAECVEVEVTSSPPGATIAIEGVPTASPAQAPWQGRLLPGRYPLTATAGGYERHAELLIVETGRPLHVSLQLTPVAPPAQAAPVAPVAPPPAEQPPAAPPPRVAVELKPIAAPAMKPPVEAALQPAPRRTHSAVHDVGWAGVAIGGAALVSAVGLGAASQSLQNSLSKTSVRTTAQADTQWANQKTYATAANALFAVGGALAATGVVVVIAF